MTQMGDMMLPSVDSVTQPPEEDTDALIMAPRDPKYDAKVNTSSTFADSLPTMNDETLRACAMANEGYETEELNDKLYLHFKGFRKIENLDKYCNLVSLFLDSNGFDKIENLGHLRKLRSLFLQKNLIRKIENLGSLVNLVQLDLSDNRISKVEGLGSLTSLMTLNLSKNVLTDQESMDKLTECESLTNVDCSNNEIADAEVITEVLGKLPNLVAVNMAGNAVNNTVGQFRKKCICAIKKLRYMDRPIFDDERATAEAWQEGGHELEQKVRKERQEKARNKDKQSLQDFRDWQKEVRRKRQEEIDSGIISEERLKEIEERQRCTIQREREAKEEAEEERKIYGQENIALVMGAKYAAKGEEKRDNFGNIIENETDEKIDGYQYGVGASKEDLKGSEGGEVADGRMLDDLYSYQGGAPKREEEREEKDEAGKKDQENEKDKNHEDVNESENNAEESGYNSQDEREMRVQESLEIYRAQKAASKKAKEEEIVEVAVAPEKEEKEKIVYANELNFSQMLMDAKKEADKEVFVIDNPSANSFYWSEGMDAELAATVHEKVFDFEEVSKALQNTLKSEDLNGLDAKMVTAESCRLRWCELDIEESNIDGESSDIAKRQQRTIPKFAIGKEGEQMSFEQLQRHVNSNQSSLLVPPSKLPGVGAVEMDEDDEDGEVQIMTRDQIFKGFVEKGGVTNFETLD